MSICKIELSLSSGGVGQKSDDSVLVDGAVADPRLLRHVGQLVDKSSVVIQDPGASSNL